MRSSAAPASTRPACAALGGLRRHARRALRPRGARIGPAAAGGRRAGGRGRRRWLRAHPVRRLRARLRHRGRALGAPRRRPDRRRGRAARRGRTRRDASSGARRLRLRALHRARGRRRDRRALQRLRARPSRPRPTAEVARAAVAVQDWSRAARVVGHEEAETGGVDITAADVLVAGGRGLGSAEGFRLCEALAQALGGEVAATRAVVDSGWYPYAAQVGQTGKTVNPKLYIACGISGAIQHKVGHDRQRHHRRDQQGRERADLRLRRPRRRRRPERRAAEADRARPRAPGRSRQARRYSTRKRRRSGSTSSWYVLEARARRARARRSGRAPRA